MLGTGRNEVGPAFDLVCLTASLGGVTAYRHLLELLPASFPAAVVVVQHRPVREHDRLPEVLDRRAELPVRLLRDGESPRPGTVHLVPAGCTAVFGAGCAVSITAVPGHRQADPLFASAAAVFGPRLIVGVLTGRLDDGALGVRHVKGSGGRVLAQDPATAEAAGMPGSALATGCVDFALPLTVLAHALVALVMAPGAAGLLRVALPSWATAITTSA
ncbi:chemotaxis protein CheB [Saccharothrix sp. BKS2]|uniref:chemotaxis protein CheB n=1 Tax=Saccharothrix sp. BKS2 TaxID=3064400 RepID=UPI0039E9B524